MAIFIGTSPGKAHRDTAGAGSRLVKLSITDDGQYAVIDGNRFKLHEDVLVFHYIDRAKTFLGVFDPDEMRAKGIRQARPLKVGMDRGDDVFGILSQSSGTADIVAMVVAVEKPLAIATIGANGQEGVMITIVNPKGQDRCLSLPLKELP